MLQETFIQQVLAGEGLAAAVEDFVSAWHCSDDSGSLSVALGFSPEEYALWVEQPSALESIIESHRSGAT